MAQLTTNVDSIVKQFLYSNQLSIHYYVQMLGHAMDISKDIEYDNYPGIKTVELTTNEYAEITMPDDYVDWIKLGCQNGGTITVLSVNHSLSRIRQTDADGNEVEFNNDITVEELVQAGYTGLFFQNAVNAYGEHLGKRYGRPGGNSAATFKEIPERNIIQLHPAYAGGSKIVLEYLSHSATATTSLIPKYGETVVRAYLEYRYCEWKFRGQKTQNDIARKRKEYVNAMRIFRARMNKMTKQDVIEVLRKNQRLSPRL